MALLSFTDIDDKIKSLSILELKQLLARVNHDLKLNKPTIKRQKKAAIITESEGVLCNRISATFTGNKAVTPVQNGKLIADIAIQRDILDYLNNGGMIITRKQRKSPRSLSVVSKVVSI